MLWDFVAITARSRADIGLILPSTAPARADDDGIKPTSARDRADIGTKSRKTGIPPTAPKSLISFSSVRARFSAKLGPGTVADVSGTKNAT